MRFVMTALGLLEIDPTEGAIGSEIIKRVGKKAISEVADAISVRVMEWIGGFMVWLSTHGLTLAAELLLVWGMCCLLVAISGKAKWLEKGVLSLLLSMALGMARLA